MLNVRQILMSAAPVLSGLVFLCFGLVGCGQRGSLYLPKEPAAANRATLPQVLTPEFPGSGAAVAPMAPASDPQQ
jgi:predicted small lipoprotein YifL